MKKVLLLASFLFLAILPTKITSMVSATENPALVYYTSPMKVNIEISKAPSLYKSAKLICVVLSVIDAPKTIAHITLPEGLVLLRGDLSWEGDIPKGGSIQFEATVQAIKIGNWTIEAAARTTSAVDSWIGGRDFIYVSVLENSASISRKTDEVTQMDKCVEVDSSEIPPRTESAETGDVPKPLVEDSTIDVVPSSPGTITIKGYFYYYDRDNVTLLPAKWVTVWAYDSDLWGLIWYFLGSDLTDENGYYEIGPINNDDGWLEDGLDVFLRFIAGNSAARVNDVNDDYYDGWTPEIANVPDGDLWFPNYRPPDSERQAWWIFYTLLDGWNYLANVAAPSYVMEQSVARWASGHDANYWCGGAGTHYHPGGQIHLDGRPTGGHANDPDVILHEYGHNVMYAVYGHWMPPNDFPGQHTWFQHEAANHAWTEGWACFLALVVPNDRFFTDTTQNFQIDLEARTDSLNNIWDPGDHVDGNVGAALWDIFDNTHDGHDVFSNGFNNIWDVVHAQTDNNFGDFWAAWRARGHNVPYATYAIYQNTIAYFGALDHITISPSSASVYRGSSRSFSAQGYDANNIPVVALTYTWSVTGGIGYVNPTSTPDTGGPGQSTTFYSTATGSGTVRATATHVNTRTGSASVTVYTGGGGGCPFISTWNGDEYLLDNNLLAASESSGGADVTDNYLLQQMLSPETDGTYSLLLSEFENEHSLFDQAQLLCVDHTSNAKVAVSPYGEVLTYTNPHPPKSAIDNKNRSVKKLVESIDGSYYEGYSGSCVILNFGDELDVSQGAKLVMRADMPIVKVSIHIQVRDANGNWNDVATIIPRVNWATEIIDMSGLLPDGNGDLKVRLYFTGNHKVDFVGLDTSQQAAINIQDTQLVSAIHSTDGDVTAKLLQSDEAYAELVPSQEIVLRFTQPAQTMEARDYLIVVEGRYSTITP